MTPLSRWPRQAIAVLLIVAAGLFVIGVTSESDDDTHSDEPTTEAEVVHQLDEDHTGLALLPGLIAALHAAAAAALAIHQTTTTTPIGEPVSS